MERAFNKNQLYTIAVEQKANSRNSTLETNSPLDGTNLVSVRTRRTKAGAKTLQGKNLIADTNFDAALVLKASGTTEVVKVPLWHIEQASLQTPHIGFPLYVAGLNVSTSYIEVGEGVTLDVGNFFELTFEFFDTKKK